MCHFLLAPMVSDEKSAIQFFPPDDAVSFSLLSIFLIFSFSEVCIWHVLVWTALVYPVWNMLTFLNLQVYIFCTVWVRVWPSFIISLTTFPAMPSFSSSSGTPIVQMLALHYNPMGHWSSVNFVLVCFLCRSDSNNLLFYFSVH